MPALAGPRPTASPAGASRARPAPVRGASIGSTGSMTWVSASKIRYPPRITTSCSERALLVGDANPHRSPVDLHALAGFGWSKLYAESADGKGAEIDVDGLAEHLVGDELAAIGPER